MRIGILSVQGAFLEHEAMLKSLGAQCLQIRQKKDLADGPPDGLVLPGGESTVMHKLLLELELYEPLKEMLENGLPVLATCAGLILLARKKEDGGPVCFGTLPVTVRRNAYGRQLGSFRTEGDFKGIGPVPMTFIRAPLILRASPETEILAAIQRPEGEQIAAVRFGSQLAMSFHPELTDNPAVHAFFLDMIKKYQNR